MAWFYVMQFCHAILSCINIKKWYSVCCYFLTIIQLFLSNFVANVLSHLVKGKKWRREGRRGKVKGGRWKRNVRKMGWKSRKGWGKWKDWNEERRERHGKGGKEKQGKRGKGTGIDGSEKRRGGKRLKRGGEERGWACKNDPVAFLSKFQLDWYVLLPVWGKETAKILLHWGSFELCPLPFAEHVGLYRPQAYCQQKSVKFLQQQRSCWVS